MVRIVASKLCTFIGPRRDSKELLDRLISAGLLAENANLRHVLAVIEGAFDAEARARESQGFPNAGETRAHMRLDHLLFGYLSARGMTLMKTDDR